MRNRNSLFTKKYEENRYYFIEDDGVLVGAFCNDEDYLCNKILVACKF